MTSPPVKSDNTIRQVDNHKRHRHQKSSFSDASLLLSRTNSLTVRPSKRPMPTPDKTIAVINASGRQAASLIRYATAVGYHVRAQLRNLLGVVATEVASNPNVEVLVGELYTGALPNDEGAASSSRGEGSRETGVNEQLIKDLFRGAQLAFINTTYYGNEIRIGEAITDAAKRAGIQHLVYSSMPDHAAYDGAWPSLPLWASKHKVEQYVKSSGLAATYVYTGIYNNNFTSLDYPLFCMELQPDGSFVWQAPFHPNVKLPWLDADHDVGPAILQIFNDGPKKWAGTRIALAYEVLSPLEACRVFAQGIGRPVRYRRGPIEIKVKLPAGYARQLEALERLYELGRDDPSRQPPYFGDRELEDSCPAEALKLWEGPRGLEEYAREVFPLEEQANGKTWMLDDDLSPAGSAPLSPEEELSIDALAIQQEADLTDEYDSDDDNEGLVMRGLKRDDEDWHA